MAQGFVQRLPCIVAAIVVFFLFVLLARGSAIPTSIRIFDRRRIVIPNSKFFTKPSK